MTETAEAWIGSGAAPQEVAALLRGLEPWGKSAIVAATAGLLRLMEPALHPSERATHGIATRLLAAFMAGQVVEAESGATDALLDWFDARGSMDEDAEIEEDPAAFWEGVPLIGVAQRLAEAGFESGRLREAVVAGVLAHRTLAGPT